jgi:prepilin-type N-terminal cleavage/methylation domain-containing protein
MTLRQTYRPRAAFTLIEIMVVCAIIGIVMTIAIPSIYRQLHPESMQKAVNDIKEACDTARGHAVLNGSTMKLVINSREKQISVVQGEAVRSESVPMDRLESRSVSGDEWRMGDRKAAGAGAGVFTAKLADTIAIEGIRLNLKDYTEDEIVEVNFYKNGTCDEFSIFLADREGERRQIWLEVATALVDIRTDPRTFK